VTRHAAAPAMVISAAAAEATRSRGTATRPSTRRRFVPGCSDGYDADATPTNSWVSPLAQKSSGSKDDAGELPTASSPLLCSSVLGSSPASSRFSRSIPSSGIHCQYGNLMSLPGSSPRPPLRSDPGNLVLSVLRSYHTPSLANLGPFSEEIW
jgi:hypothetical protein